MPSPDFYKSLGVDRNASKKEVQAAYRRLARKHHPDVTKGDKASEERFKAINAAYEVLSDGKKRSAYDKWGAQWQHAEQLEKLKREQQQRFTGGEGGLRFEFGGEPGVFDDIGDPGGGFGSLFERFFSGSRRRAQVGQTLRHTLTVSLREAYGGARRTVQLQGSQLCPTCGGAGIIRGATCHACQGGGREAAGKRLEVAIPKGVETGSKIRLRGKGAPGSGGGQAGDVILEITVAPDRRFERKGATLNVDVPVPWTTALLGGEVKVPTLTGHVMLRIPAGTQNGRVFRLAGKGMPVLRKATTGDLLAKAAVVLPERLTPEQRALVEELRRLEAGEEPGPSADDGRRSA